MVEPDPRTGKYFEAFEVGETYDVGGRTVSRGDLTAYVGVSGNNAESHTNREVCRAAGHPDQIVHGGVVFAIQQGLASGLFRAAAGSLYGYDRIRFTHTVYPGDTISVTVTVEDTEAYDADRGLLTLKREATTQDGELCFVGTSKHLVRKADTG